MKRLITLSFLTVLFLFSCKKERLTANGDSISETRNPGVFTKVNMSGSNNVHIAYGATYQVELRGSSNLIPYFKTNIVNGRLYLSYEDANVRQDDVQVFITMPILNGVRLSGSAKINITGNFPKMDFLDFDISGSGDMEVNDSFEAQEVSINISGSDSVKAEKVRSNEADVTISGSGDVRIGAEQKLKAVISGSGKIYYTGSAIVDSRISGSGRIIKL